jgi:signal transduction histidine kinase
MWRERPSRALLKTSGFRLALRSLALSLGGAILVFLIIHHDADAIWREQNDTAVNAALSDILSDIQEDNQGVAPNVRETIDEGGGLFFADIGPGGTLRAGNFNVAPALLANWHGMQSFERADGLTLPPRVLAVRGVAHRFANGETLLIAANASPLLTLNALVARSFTAVFGTILALGLLNGYFAAHAASRRVDGYATAIEEIMNGDLSRRLTVGRAGDEFDRLATGLNAMLQRLQELMENLRQVTNDISHDLRSPLARLREHLELSRRRFAGAELAAMFDEALAQIDQALDIFTAMLRIAEVEAGARRRKFAALPLSSLLEELAETYEPAFSTAGIALTAQIQPRLLLRGDKELLLQMLANLLDNVMLHADGASIAHITAAQTGGHIDIEISDNGAGIPESEQARVFQRFVRLDASRHLPGHGLGLSLATAIAALHDGSIALRDNHPGLKAVVSLGNADQGTGA